VEHQVSLDIVSSRFFIPGTNKLKETYMNKVRSLQNMGWKHLVFTEDQLKQHTIGSIIKNIQKCYVPYVEEQKTVLEYWKSKEEEELMEVNIKYQLQNL
jgi:hypothetical protein